MSHSVPPHSGTIFQKQDTLKEAQRGILRPVAFRPHLTMGLAFYRRGFKLPTGKNRLLGAGHIQFEVFFHWVTSLIEGEWLAGYYLNFARNIDFRATGSFFDFRRLNIQFQNSVQEISCLRKVQGKPAWPKRPLNPWSCPGTCHIQRFEKALHDRCPGIVNGIFDLFTVAVGNHLGGNE